MSDQIGLFGAAAEPATPATGKAARGIGPAAQDDQTRRIAAQLPATIHLGTSSWSFPGWAGIVYDKPAGESTLSRRGLAAYSAHPLLRTVSIDRSFYAPLSRVQYETYAAQVPDDFRFMVKAPAFITDELRRDENGRGVEPNPRFLEVQGAFDEFVKPAIAGLGQHAGPLVFQFSPLSRRTLADVPAFAARLHAFFGALRQQCEGFSHAPLFAVEVRNGELLTREFAEALKDVGARYVLGVHARMPTPEEQLPLLRALWPGPLVVRWNLHAGFKYEEAKAQYAPFNRLVDEDPASRATIAKVAAATALAGQPVYISANNKAEGSAPLTIYKLAQAIATILVDKSTG
jgi:uncharacterized protein YecE (DUF72 family)